VPVERLELCVDCNDRERIRGWWREALEWEEALSPGGEAVELRDPRSGMRIWFQEVPEAKILKNRLHLDVYLPADEVPHKRGRLEQLGGSVVDAGHERFVVLADPEGNELCLCWD